MNSKQESDRDLFETILTGTAGLYESELLKFLQRSHGKLSTQLKTVITFASLFLKSGHSCLPLDKTVSEWAEIIELDCQLPDDLPGIEIDHLQKSSIVGNPQNDNLFIVDNHMFYFRKQWNLENSLAQKINSRITRKRSPIDFTTVRKHLEQLFPSSNDSDDQRQTLSALLSLCENLVVITGGPGTGKTTAISKIVALQTALSDKPIRVALAAPTGKASARLTESFQKAVTHGVIQDSSGVLGSFNAMTIHRLLSGWITTGLLPSGRRFKLPYDIIIIDEASMIDLSLMHHLFENTDINTSIILLGDSDQLASVQGGAIFAELCSHPLTHVKTESAQFIKMYSDDYFEMVTEVKALSLPVIRFEKNYRVKEAGSLREFAKAVREGSTEAVLEIGHKQNEDSVTFHPFTYDTIQIQELIQSKFQLIEKCQTLDLNDLLTVWQIEVTLSALRNGPQGAVELNRKIEEFIVSKRQFTVSDSWYTGRPIIITKNDYKLDLFNGDSGVCKLDETGVPWIYFQSNSSGFVRYPASLLRNYEPGYVITVHKSQGSEYERVILLLPEELSPVLNRELLYTAITRARKTCTIMGDEDIFLKAMNRKSYHFSALGEKIGSFKKNPV